MFEKANPVSASQRTAIGHSRPDERSFARAIRRSGEALRAVEWSEITARLNAARDLRMLLRTESQAPIAPVAASFGDAAASYFALLDEGEDSVNPDALGQSKALGVMIGHSDANRPGPATGEKPDPSHGDAREMQ